MFLYSDFQIYDLLPPLVAKASTVRYGAGKAEPRNLNMKNCLPDIRRTPEKAVKNPIKYNFLGKYATLPPLPAVPLLHTVLRLLPPAPWHKALAPRPA